LLVQMKECREISKLGELFFDIDSVSTDERPAKHLFFFVVVVVTAAVEIVPGHAATSAEEAVVCVSDEECVCHVDIEGARKIENIWGVVQGQLFEVR